jgi:hypothetical protein
MRRVCRPKGDVVILTHFKSQNHVIPTLEEMAAPGETSGARVSAGSMIREVR